MLNSLDIALLFDNRTVDGVGNVITKDRSRNGINAQLGNGVDAGTMPTWDATRGLYTFDGGDYLTFSIAGDVGGILDSMGSIQNETYIVVMDPIMINSYAAPQYLFASKWGAGGNSYFYIQLEAINNRIRFILADAAGNLEILDLPGAEGVLLHGKRVMLTWVREPTHATEPQRLFVNAVKRATAATTPRDAHYSCDKYIGCHAGIAANLYNGTSLRFFGYARRCLTTTSLQAIQKYLRGVI